MSRIIFSTWSVLFFLVLTSFRIDKARRKNIHFFEIAPKLYKYAAEALCREKKFLMTIKENFKCFVTSKRDPYCLCLFSLLPILCPRTFWGKPFLPFGLNFLLSALTLFMTVWNEWWFSLSLFVHLYAWWAVRKSDCTTGQGLKIPKRTFHPFHEQHLLHPLLQRVGEVRAPLLVGLLLADLLLHLVFQCWTQFSAA